MGKMRCINEFRGAFHLLRTGEGEKVVYPISRKKRRGKDCMKDFSSQPKHGSAGRPRGKVVALHEKKKRVALIG